jgi:hypothetical protein
MRTSLRPLPLLATVKYLSDVQKSKGGHDHLRIEVLSSRRKKSVAELANPRGVILKILSPLAALQTLELVSNVLLP